MESNLDKINELISLKEFENAKVELEKFLALESDNIEALKLLGLCNVNLGCFPEGRKNFETVVKYKNDDATSWFYLANCYDNLDDFLHAKTAYLEVIKLRENYTEAYKNLCVVYMKNNEPNLAIELGQKAALLAPEDYIFYYLVGTAYMAKKDFKSSIPYFEKALELNPNHSQLQNNLGTAYLTVGQYDSAFEKYLLAAELDPKNSLTFYNIASILQIKNKHIEACEYFKKAYAIEKAEHYLVSLALSEFKSGQFQEAINHYKFLVSQHPEKHNFQYNLACCYEMIGEYTFAIGILDQLVVLNPKSTNMAQKLANLFLKTNQPLKAKEIYHGLITQGLVTAEIYYEYALICVGTGDLDIAESIFKKVVELNPDFAAAHKDLGVIYVNKRLFDYAAEEFEKAYALKPDEPSIILEYANFKHAISDFSGAKELYKKVLAKDPNNFDILMVSSLNSLAINELDDALRYAEAALKIAPENDFMYYIAGKIYYSMKNFDKAQMALIKSIEIRPSRDNKNLLALNYYELGEYEKANTIFLSLLKSKEFNVNLLISTAKCYEKLADFEAAKKQLRKVLEIFPEMEEATELLARISE